MVKSSTDTRYEASNICTHDMNKMPAISALTIGEILEQLKLFDIVGIDEGQFFADIAPRATQLADEGKTIIIASLNAGYQQQVSINI